jgi:hypothetical protein
MRWSIQVRWRARDDWRLADGASRVARAVGEVRAAFPGQFDTVKLRQRGEPGPADDPGLADRLAPVLKASRNRVMFAGTDLLGDAAVTVTPVPFSGMAADFSQSVTGAGPHDSRFEMRAEFGHGNLLTADPERLVSLVDTLAVILEARNSWVDFPHVRRDWNRSHSECPVYGWATWLHPGFATVDTTGLDVVERAGSGGGRLLLLPVDPAEMGNPGGTVGRETIVELARRTVFADGRKLIEVNPYLQED